MGCTGLYVPILWRVEVETVCDNTEIVETLDVLMVVVLPGRSSPPDCTGVELSLLDCAKVVFTSRFCRVKF